MPDWSYHTVFQPLLAHLPADRARRLAIGALGSLGRIPGGKQVIAWMGHMRVPPEGSVDIRGHVFASRVGLCLGLDPNLEACEALDQFGFGFLEYGPILQRAEAQPQRTSVDFAAQSIQIESEELTLDIRSTTVHRTRARLRNTRLLFRIDDSVCPDALPQVLRDLAGAADGFVVPLEALRQAAAAPQVEDHHSPLLLALVGLPNPRTDVDLLRRLTELATSGGIDGVLVDGSRRTGSDLRRLGSSAFAPTRARVVDLRQHVDDKLVIIAAGGVHQPREALSLLAAGADFVAVDSGMVFGGPGLPKRINEAIMQAACACDVPGSDRSQSPVRYSWLWSLLMGVSMLLGGMLAMMVAMTQVVLPYDEATVGMTRAQLALVNDRLLDFMAHDRVTLAGTMLAVGMLYSALSWFGSRCGEHWAQRTIVCSAFAGFLSFFLFLGFGYFDAFHAFVTCILFQFLLLTVFAELPARRIPVRFDLENDWKWKCGLWSQLLFIMHGCALIVAGVVICKIGITSVFVAEDMEFLCTTPDRLLAANPQLVPLVAHDRATFGGMLIACGIVVLLASLWGFRRGRRWLWWTLLVAGSVAYIATISIHLHVGYVSLVHLLPAYGGIAALWIAATLGYAYAHDIVVECPVA